MICASAVKVGRARGVRSRARPYPGLAARAPAIRNRARGAHNSFLIKTSTSLGLSGDLCARSLAHLPAHDSKECKMANGTVKWFNPQKGYGFIKPEDGSGDVFVHITAVERAGLAGLAEGQRVSYDLEQGRQGKT